MHMRQPRMQIDQELRPGQVQPAARRCARGSLTADAGRVPDRVGRAPPDARAVDQLLARHGAHCVPRARDVTRCMGGWVGLLSSHKGR